MIPYKEWAAKRECHNCGELGHIARECPKPKKRSQRTHDGQGRGDAQGRRRGRGASDGGRGRGRDGSYRRGRGRENSTKRLDKAFEAHKAFAAALANLEEDTSSVEDDTEYLANNAAAELEYSDTESVESSGSTAIKAHAARMYESLSLKD